MTWVASNGLTVMPIEHRTEHKWYYAVSRGKEGGPPVTISIRDSGIVLCHTCGTTFGCLHADAAKEYDTSLSGSSQGPKEGV